MKQIKVRKIHLPIGKKNLQFDQENFFSFELAGEHPSGKKFFKSKTQRYKLGTIHILRQQKNWGMYQKKPKIMQL